MQVSTSFGPLVVEQLEGQPSMSQNISLPMQCHMLVVFAHNLLYQ